MLQGAVYGLSVFWGLFLIADSSLQIQLLISAHEFWENEKFHFISEKVSSRIPCRRIGLDSEANNLPDERNGLGERIHSRSMQGTTTTS